MIIIGMLIVFTLRKLYNKMKAKLNKLKTQGPHDNNNSDDDDNDDENNVKIGKYSEKFIELKESIVKTQIDEEENDNNKYISFSHHRGCPAVRICSNKNCEFMQICNIQLCKHLTNKGDSKIHNDKHTLQNVTYIHVSTNCIIVFITSNKNLCAIEQELSLEDVNFINAYTSKYPDLAIYTIFYDTEHKKFIDINQRQYDDNNEYKISLTNNTSVPKREILRSFDSHKNMFNASAPPPLLQPPPDMDKHGNFYYIAKPN